MSIPVKMKVKGISSPRSDGVPESCSRYGIFDRVRKGNGRKFLKGIAGLATPLIHKATKRMEMLVSIRPMGWAETGDLLAVRSQRRIKSRPMYAQMVVA